MDSERFYSVLEGFETYFDILRCSEAFLLNWGVQKFPDGSEVFCNMLGFSEVFVYAIDILVCSAAFWASHMSSKWYWKVAEASFELL